jgi:chromosome segregation ATPase
MEQVMKNLVERTQTLIDHPQFRVTDSVASLLLARIAELEAELKNRDVRIAELKKEIETDNKNLSDQFDLLQEAGLKIDKLEKRLSYSETLGKRQQLIRDLEQQAKGVDDYANKTVGVPSMLMQLRIRELYAQAKALEGKNI